MKYLINRRRALLSSLALSALSLAMSTPALAQATAPAASPAPAAAGLEEIVVTARKTSENLVAVPLSVSALSAADLKNRGIESFVGLQDYTPGFKFINQSVNRNDRGYYSFIMRGMNPGTPVAYQQGVSVFIDGAAVAGGTISGLNDVERVEVIKGPQSAYFGRSTFAGAVNFITRQPGFTPSMQVEALGSSYNTFDFNAEAEGGIYKDVLAGRLAIRAAGTGGEYTDPNRLSGGAALGAQKTYSLSGELLFRPTENLKVRVFGKYWKDDDGPAATPYIYPSQYNCNATQAGYTVTGLQFVGGKNYVCGTLPAFTNASLSINTAIPASVASVLGARSPATISGLANKVGNLAPEDFTLDHLGLKRTGYALHSLVHYDLPAGFALDGNVAIDSNHWAFLVDTTTKDLTSTPNPNYASANYTATNTPGFYPFSQAWAEGTDNDDDLSGEVRLTSPQDKRLKGMVGVSYYTQRSVNGTLAYGNTGYVQASNLATNNATTPAVFFNITYNILGNLDLSVEGRQQWDTIQNIQYAANIQFKQTFPSFSPRAILSYHPTSDTTIYASFAQGTRPGSFNGSFAALLPAYQAQIRAQSPVSLTVPEQKVQMEELGFKSRFLDNRAQILTAIYYGDWTNRAIPDKVYYTDVNGLLQNTLFNIAGGHTELYGVEAEGRFQATRSFLLEATFDYAGTKVLNTYCGDCALITGNPYPKGTTMEGYPALTGSLAGTYSRKAFGEFDGFLRLEYVYTGNIWLDESNTTGTGDANKVNVRLGLHNDHYRVELFGDNINNNKTYIFGQRYSDATPAAGSGLTTTPVNEISLSAPQKPHYGIKVTASF
jgi:iron complex outermembrane receptor protein